MAEDAAVRWIALDGDLPRPGGMRAAEVDGRALLVCNVEGSAYAIEDRCPHVHAPLHDGRLEGSVLQCPLHGGKLDVRDGSVVAPPIRRPVPTFPVRAASDGRGVEIGLPASGPGCPPPPTGGPRR